MSQRLSSFVSNAGDLLALEVEELAGVLLLHLKSFEGTPGNTVYQNGLISQLNFVDLLEKNAQQPQPEYGQYQSQVNAALLEAWAWLEREGFLIRQPKQPLPWFFVSRRGQRVISRQDFDSYRKASVLPKGLLHSLIAIKVYPAFLRGEYDTAIFQAFREIEIAVRDAGKFPHDLVGDKLMRAAFASADGNTPAGPLTDNSLPAAEQKAMSHLFAGAFGVYRNSTGHRHVPTTASDAAEVIMFASQLLKIVDRLKQPSVP